VEEIQLLLSNQKEIQQRLEAVEGLMAEIKKSLLSSTVRDSYTVEQAAKRLGKAEWTVRQWCNKGLVPGAQKVHGRGRQGEWRVPHEALVRLETEGPTKPVTQRVS
jgi:transposase